MWKTLNWLQKNLVWSIPLAMLAGLLFGQFTDPAFLRMAILPLTFLMVYPMMVTMNFKELFTPGGAKLHGVAQAITSSSCRPSVTAWACCFSPTSPWCAWRYCSPHCCRLQA